MRARGGCVESFDGETLAGWVEGEVESGLGVEIYVDGVRVASVSASITGAGRDEGRPELSRRSFVHRFAKPFCDPSGPLIIPAVPQLSVYRAGTDRALSVNPDLRGVVNVDDLSDAEALLAFSDNGFMPVPEVKLRAHVSGSGMSPRDFRANGLFVVQDLMHWGLLWPNRRIMDLGCGCGRVAAHLAPIVQEHGRYWGFDTWAEGIRWATKNITATYSNSTFHVLGGDVRKAGPGYVGHQAYALPLASESIDLVLCASLFTHLTFEAALAYLAELRRLIHHGGRIYFSCFVLDDEAREALAPLRLRSDAYGAYADHASFFDTYFTRSTLDALFERSRLKPKVLRYGHWRGARYTRRRPIGYQDLFVLGPEPG